MSPSSLADAFLIPWSGTLMYADSQDALQGQEGLRQVALDSPNMAEMILVPGPPEPINCSAQDFTSASGVAKHRRDPAFRTEILPSHDVVPQMLAIEYACSSPVRNVLMNSRKDSRRRTYLAK